MKSRALGALVGCVLLAIAGCGEQEFPGNDTAAATTESAKPTPKAKPSASRLGDSIRLAASATTLRVTASSVIDPVYSDNEYVAPAPGKRFVGVELILENVGKTGVNETPPNAARLIYGNDRQATSAYVLSDECDILGFTDVNLAPGDRRMGCVAFEIPEGDAPRKIQYTPTSGMSTQTGEWLTGAPPARKVAVDAGVDQTSNGDASSSLRACGEVTASPATTCEFANQVLIDYRGDADLNGARAVTLDVYSAAVGRTVAMACSLGDRFVTCKGGSGAEVIFSGTQLNP